MMVNGKAWANTVISIIIHYHLTWLPFPLNLLLSPLPTGHLACLPFYNPVLFVHSFPIFLHHPFHPPTTSKCEHTEFSLNKPSVTAVLSGWHFLLLFFPYAFNCWWLGLCCLSPSYTLLLSSYLTFPLEHSF
jgi:hypothetical protein